MAAVAGAAGGIVAGSAEAKETARIEEYDELMEGHASGLLFCGTTPAKPLRTPVEPPAGTLKPPIDPPWTPLLPPAGPPGGFGGTLD